MQHCEYIFQASIWCKPSVADLTNNLFRSISPTSDINYLNWSKDKRVQHYFRQEVGFLFCSSRKLTKGQTHCPWIKDRYVDKFIPNTSKKHKNSTCLTSTALLLFEAKHLLPIWDSHMLFVKIPSGIQKPHFFFKQHFKRENNEEELPSVPLLMGVFKLFHHLLPPPCSKIIPKADNFFCPLI